MRAPPTWAASCQGKHPYPNGTQAWRVASRVKTGRATAYRCTYCRQWHVGNAVRRIKDDETETVSAVHNPGGVAAQRKRIAKAATWAIKAHALCLGPDDKAAVLDILIARFQEITRHEPSDR